MTSDNSIGSDKTITGTAQSGGYTLSVGQTLGQYKIIRPLGRGGMGEVYLCEHAILTTRHAVKLLPAERSASEGFLQRFHDEARVMARLQHPGIVHVTHADEQDRRHYLVMDFIAADGTDEPFDLEDALASAPENRLEPAVVARLSRQIAEAVGSAHAASVVHRDLKPANVLLTSADLQRADVRVADFGLARLLGEDWLRSVVDVSMRQSMSMGGDRTLVDKPRAERSTTGSILGTYEYMSPEQREGRDADSRSDVFALGVMLYRMVTGKRLMGRAKAASKLVVGLDDAWDDLIDSCLEEDPADRPADMAAVATSLGGLYEAEIGAAAKESEKKRRGEEASRRAKAERARLEQERPAAAEARQRSQEARRDELDSLSRPVEPPAVPKPKKRRGGHGFALLVVIAAVIGFGVLISRDSKPSRGPAARPSAPAVSPRPTPPSASTPAAVHKPEPERQTPVQAAPSVPVARKDQPKSVDTRTVDLGGGVSLELVWIPPGEFTMGSPANESGRYNDEGPQHRVTLTKGFWMGKTPVTQRQWRQLMGTARQPHFKNAGEDAPMESLNWHDAKEFCGKLQERLSGDLRALTARLPTEAEWEYACRAGTTTGLYSGKELTSTTGRCRNLDEIAWYGQNSGSTTKPVGQKQPNAWGLHDMLGNVWEWCEDGKRSYTTTAQTDPVGSGSSRVLRGGSWVNVARRCRSASRYDYAPGNRYGNHGFRVVVR
jgi:formylglycine-generating enzyme required for sulfatase activity/serine/threonine protein kinase